MEKLAYEMRNGLTEGNPSEWGKEGSWRGNQFLGGCGEGWDSSYEPLSEELSKEITESVNALAGCDPSKLANVLEAAKAVVAMHEAGDHTHSEIERLAVALAAFYKKTTCRSFYTIKEEEEIQERFDNGQFGVGA